MHRVIWIGQIEQRLDDLRCEHIVLLPQIQHANDAALVFGRTPEQIDKGGLHVAGEPWRKHIFVGAELMARLADDRVDDIQTGHFVLGLALENELLDTLDDMLVELDRLHGTLRDGGHLRLRDGRPSLVEPRQLNTRQQKWKHIFI